MPEKVTAKDATGKSGYDLGSDNSKTRRMRSHGGFLLGLYAFVGYLVLLITQGVWYESMLKLGKTPAYSFHVTEGFLWWIFSIPSFLLILVVTDDAKTHKSIPSRIVRIFGKNTRREESEPIVVALLNATIMSITSIFYFVVIPGFLNAFTIGFVVINAGIVAVASFYHVALPAWELWEKKDEYAQMEALKLEHDSVMSLGNSVIWAAIILIASVVFITWTQVIFPMVDPEMRLTAAFTSLQAMSVAQLAYLSIGVWFGILQGLWNYAWRIRKKIAKLRLEKR